MISPKRIVIGIAVGIILIPSCLFVAGRIPPVQEAVGNFLFGQRIHDRSSLSPQETQQLSHVLGIPLPTHSQWIHLKYLTPAGDPCKLIFSMVIQAADESKIAQALLQQGWQKQAESSLRLESVILPASTPRTLLGISYSTPGEFGEAGFFDRPNGEILFVYVRDFSPTEYSLIDPFFD